MGSWHGPGKEITLAAVDVQVLEFFKLLFCLDSLGYEVTVHASPERDQSSHQGPRFFILNKRVDEAAIDLDGIERQSMEVAEG